MTTSILQCFTCNFCDLKFKNSNDLDLHNQLHTSSGDFSCLLCKEIFPDLTELQLHDLQHSLEEIKEGEKIPSPINITFLQPASSFACKICYKVFLSDEELFDHFTHHADVENNINRNLSESSNEFETEEYFKPPVSNIVCKRSYHKVTLNQIPKHATSNVDGPFECKTCKKVFNGPSSLNRHQRRFHLNKRKYMCIDCHKTFAHFSLLCEHSLQHYKTKKQEFECYVCKKHFSSSMLLLEHMFISHVCQNKNFCQACFKFFATENDLTQHMEDHIIAYNCNKCRKWYKTKSKLNNHRCVFDGPRPYPCKICGKRFSRLYHLQRHCYMHDRKQGFSKVLGVDSEFFEQQKFNSDSINNGEELLIHFKKKYECYMCNTRWYSFKNYKQHFCSEHKELEFNSCPVCFKKFSKTCKVKRHLVTHSKEKLFKCNLCTKSFLVQAALNRHKKKHNNRKLLSCYQCSKTFVNKLGFQKHILMHEQGRKAAFKCTCGSQLIKKMDVHLNNSVSFDEFKDRLQLFHSDDIYKVPSLKYTSDQSDSKEEFILQTCPSVKYSKTFLSEIILSQNTNHSSSESDIAHECNTCRKTFNNLSSLKRHNRRIHLNKRPYTCIACHRTFLQLSLLSRHSLLHLRKKPEEFICPICQKTFSKSVILQKHIFSIHACQGKPFCFGCFRFLATKDELDNHMKDHLVSDAYDCDKCEKRYKSESDRAKHRCIYNGPRPYLCKLCGKRFNRLYHLERHLDLHKRKRSPVGGTESDSDCLEKQNISLNSKNSVISADLISSTKDDVAEESLTVNKKFEYEQFEKGVND
ncbi:zinc finger protein 836-like [Argiope bruennichi]|uniref:zinc finger protein 836-like n=1 Tax=Argiope bruennichi TaxID=94029 RepID=UPI0024946DA7|nr:zinc finger protein 836-like [Argiope bruennichi]